MGMYTGLRFKGIVHKDYYELFDEVVNKGTCWDELIDKFPFIEPYANEGRANMIPHGSLSYMPDDWEEKDGTQNEYGHDNYVPTNNFDTQFNTSTGYLAFQCSLKNYQGEIEKFFEHILPIVLEESHHIEYFYEEWDCSDMYVLEKGLEERKIEYHDEGPHYY